MLVSGVCLSNAWMSAGGIAFFWRSSCQKLSHSVTSCTSKAGLPSAV